MHVSQNKLFLWKNDKISAKIANDPANIENAENQMTAYKVLHKCRKMKIEK